MENHNTKDMIKFKNDLEIANMLLFEKIEKEIEDVIDEGIDQYTFYISDKKTNFWYEHKKKFFEEYVIPHLTIHNTEEEQERGCNSYNNGYYYYKHDCMCPYEVEYNNDLTLSFTRIESDEEDEEHEEDEDEEHEEHEEYSGKFIYHPDDGDFIPIPKKEIPLYDDFKKCNVFMENYYVPKYSFMEYTHESVISITTSKEVCFFNKRIFKDFDFSKYSVGTIIRQLAINNVKIKNINRIKNKETLLKKIEEIQAQRF